MKKISISTKKIGQYAGKWVAIDPKKDLIIAVGNTLKDISPFVSGRASSKDKIAAASFKVPRKDEGPYILNSFFQFTGQRGFFPAIQNYF